MPDLCQGLLPHRLRGAGFHAGVRSHAALLKFFQGRLLHSARPFQKILNYSEMAGGLCKRVGWETASTPYKEMLKHEPPVEYVRHGAVSLPIRRSPVKALIRDPAVPRGEGEPPVLVEKVHDSFYVDARIVGRGRIRAATSRQSKRSNAACRRTRGGRDFRLAPSVSGGLPAQREMQPPRHTCAEASSVVLREQFVKPLREVSVATQFRHFSNCNQSALPPFSKRLLNDVA